ncbi:MAG: rhomboid family intramembrane serine protease [Atribacterota bacterium]|nr:rhomboid family intramembrane serine protease [Atribacterota bacterium]MDD4895503.1 rhomboid family intramembrane serine protease [Atribacterota bacterium]MDD5636323.1 rhomboid family intramembrane serine protease [Atribacterota bacterium]
MLPLWDEIPTRKVPIITIVLVLINCLVYYYQFFIVIDQNIFIYAYGLIPFEITKGVDLFPPGPSPIYFTVLSSMFMHGSFVHLFGNMLYLWIFGNNVEDYLGKFRYIIFYVLSGVFAALGQVIVSSNSQIPMIGASGAVAGVLGAYFILFPRARITTLIFFGFFIRLIKLPALFVLGLWIIFQLFYGLSDLSSSGGVTGVAWFAHIGGFIGGIILIKLFNTRKRHYYQ